MAFWQEKALGDMTTEEWESLCDGCGKCCLHKIEDEDTDELFYTRIACRLLDISSCRCSDYPNRKQLVPECLKLRPEDVDQFHWLPDSCAYRLVAEGQSLPDWHHLVSGDQQTIHQQGYSVCNWAVSEDEVSEDEWFDLVIESGLDHP